MTPVDLLTHTISIHLATIQALWDQAARYEAAGMPTAAVVAEATKMAEEVMQMQQERARAQRPASRGVLTLHPMSEYTPGTLVYGPHGKGMVIAPPEQAGAHPDGCVWVTWSDVTIRACWVESSLLRPRQGIDPGPRPTR